MVIRYLDPRATQLEPPEPYGLALDVRTRPVTVALLANNYVDAERFLDHVQTALGSAFPTVSTLRYLKPNTSPASPDMQLDIVKKCDAVISAYGH